MITFWILGFSIAFILRCVFAKPYKDDEERFKDKWRGYFSALKQGKFFDSILDHNMGAYHEYIANMDDKGEQLPK